MNSTAVIPVVLFAYARPVHLARALAGLRRDGVPLIYAFADGPNGRGDAERVEAVRAQLRAIDWCEVCLSERPHNLGLGRNILSGVSEVAARHAAFVVWEDDLVSAPGGYAWMTAALRHYATDARVFSVTGWTHPSVSPAGIAAPYFDARAESWGWGSYARAWVGMENESAAQKLARLQEKGIAPDTCGADLPEMARHEASRNIWAVRWLYHHLLHGGLCLRPPLAFIEHAGFDDAATNARTVAGWHSSGLPAAAPAPGAWPEPRESPECRQRWRQMEPGPWRRRWQRWTRGWIRST